MHGILVTREKLTNTLFSYNTHNCSFFLPPMGRGLGQSCLPITVVGRQWVGDMSPRHQEKSASNMPDTADRQEEEGIPEADVAFMKELWRKEQHIRIAPVLTKVL